MKINKQQKSILSLLNCNESFLIKDIITLCPSCTCCVTQPSTSSTSTSSSSSTSTSSSSTSSSSGAVSTCILNDCSEFTNKVNAGDWYNCGDFETPGMVTKFKNTLTMKSVNYLGNTYNYFERDRFTSEEISNFPNYIGETAVHGPDDEEAALLLTFSTDCGGLYNLNGDTNTCPSCGCSSSSSSSSSTSSSGGSDGCSGTKELVTRNVCVDGHNEVHVYTAICPECNGNTKSQIEKPSFKKTTTESILEENYDLDWIDCVDGRCVGLKCGPCNNCTKKCINNEDTVYTSTKYGVFDVLYVLYENNLNNLTEKSGSTFPTAYSLYTVVYGPTFVDLEEQPNKIDYSYEGSEDCPCSYDDKTGETCYYPEEIGALPKDIISGSRFNFGNVSELGECNPPDYKNKKCRRSAASQSNNKVLKIEGIYNWKNVIDETSLPCYIKVGWQKKSDFLLVRRNDKGAFQNIIGLEDGYNASFFGKNLRFSTKTKDNLQLGDFYDNAFGSAYFYPNKWTAISTGGDGTQINGISYFNTNNQNPSLQDWFGIFNKYLNGDSTNDLCDPVTLNVYNLTLNSRGMSVHRFLGPSKTTKNFNDSTLDVKAATEFIKNINADTIETTDPTTIQNFNNCTEASEDRHPSAQTTAIFNNSNNSKESLLNSSTLTGADGKNLLLDTISLLDGPEPVVTNESLISHSLGNQGSYLFAKKDGTVIGLQHTVKPGENEHFNQTGGTVSASAVSPSRPVGFKGSSRIVYATGGPSTTTKFNTVNINTSVISTPSEFTISTKTIDGCVGCLTNIDPANGISVDGNNKLRYVVNVTQTSSESRENLGSHIFKEDTPGTYIREHTGGSVSGAGATIRGVASGEGHNVVVLSDGKIKMSSGISNGEYSTPTDDYNNYKWNSEEPNVKPFKSSVYYGSVAAGSNHTCSMSDEGITCWGRNNEGQCEVPPLPSSDDSKVKDKHGTHSLIYTNVTCFGNCTAATVGYANNPNRGGMVITWGNCSEHLPCNIKHENCNLGNNGDCNFFNRTPFEAGKNKDPGGFDEPVNPNKFISMLGNNGPGISIKHKFIKNTQKYIYNETRFCVEPVQSVVYSDGFTRDQAGCLNGDTPQGQKIWITATVAIDPKRLADTRTIKSIVAPTPSKLFLYGQENIPYSAEPVIVNGFPVFTGHTLYQRWMRNSSDKWLALWAEHYGNIKQCKEIEYLLCSNPYYAQTISNLSTDWRALFYCQFYGCGYNDCDEWNSSIPDVVCSSSSSSSSGLPMPSSSSSRPKTFLENQDNTFCNPNFNKNVPSLNFIDMVCAGWVMLLDEGKYFYDLNFGGVYKNVMPPHITNNKYLIDVDEYFLKWIPESDRQSWLNELSTYDTTYKCRNCPSVKALNPQCVSKFQCNCLDRCDEKPCVSSSSSSSSSSSNCTGRGYAESRTKGNNCVDVSCPGCRACSEYCGVTVSNAKHDVATECNDKPTCKGVSDEWEEWVSGSFWCRHCHVNYPEPNDCGHHTGGHSKQGRRGNWADFECLNLIKSIRNGVIMWCSETEVAKWPGITCEGYNPPQTVSSSSGRSFCK